MNYGAKKMDAYSVTFQTSMNRNRMKQYLREAKDMSEDSYRFSRLKTGECKICFYVSSRIGGAAMTEQPCGICGKVLMFGSTCTDALCPECAKRHDLCKHCGCDRELRPKRRKFDWIEPVKAEDKTPSNRAMQPVLLLLPRKQ